MRTLNYKHLHYFWTVARAGSLSRAAERLDITPQTLSEQLRQFERAIGATVFTRSGRRLVLTETGRLVQGYADEMFVLGEALEDALESGSSQAMLFRVGVADAVPKAVAYHLLEPVVIGESAVRLVCREGELTELLAQLAANRLDIVIADSPMPESSSVRGFNHLLGHCGTVVFGSRTLAAKHAGAFPACLNHAPMLLPAEHSPIRSRLMRYFSDHRVRPDVVGEFDDSALMKAFGQAGTGFFPGPSAISSEIQRQFDVVAVGTASEVTMSFYAITVERKLAHPMVVRMEQSAREEFFRR
ncbi:MAG: transcriptional activator NhaR [Betaproteobacteria bacterium]|nr:transcriptional activator NhaR [Betaproteobacteria bacterium]